MAIAFTPEQQQVIELHNSNILVSAAAGSGKTAVLVERIVQMVCDEEHPVDIDKLLVVTFTNAAAAEMRDRIGQAIAARLEVNPGSAHLQKQATLLHNALITTIDSFSLFLIRNHFNEIGLDPTFRVADEGEIKLLQQDVLAEVLEEAFAEADEKFLHMVEVFCANGKETALENHILALAKYAGSFPWPTEWLAERKNDYALQDASELLSGPCGAYLKQYVKNVLAGCIQKLEIGIRMTLEPDGPHMYGETLEKDVEMLRKLADCDDILSYPEKLETVAFDRLSGKKDPSVNEYKRDAAKNLRDEVKKGIKKLKEDFFATNQEISFRQSAACYEPVAVLIDLTLRFQERVKERKQDKKIIDFSDMEHYALDILLRKENGKIVPSGVALEYRQFFHEILIDEYQDSNLVQEYLLKAVSGEEDGSFNRFMVGDVKQSIYKFRLARPELFLEKYQTYREEGNFRRIDLAKNFRSRAEVVDSVNEVFSYLMSEECGGITYDEKAKLYAGAEYPAGEDCQTELMLVNKPTKDDEYSAKEAEGLAIAGRIKELLQTQKVCDKQTKQLRPAKYSDMVILLRSTSGWDDALKEILEQQGIPAYISAKTGYFSTMEVQELLNVLRVLNNPYNDISLFGMMQSVFGGFKQEEIALLRSADKKVSLYEALLASDSEHAKQFLELLQTYRKYTVFMPIRELLEKLVEEFSYLNYVTALPGGSKRRANVEMLFKRASDFEQTSYFGLFHFIRYIEQLEKYEVDFGEADTLDENADVVRIMSIHKSKGLEFPITFVSALSKKFNMQDTSDALILDMDLGLATDYTNPITRVKNKTLRKEILAAKMREDSLAEELRILYVALTRAKEKLIMTGVLDKADEKLEMLHSREKQRGETISYLEFATAGSFMDLVLPAVVKENSTVNSYVVTADEIAQEQEEEQFRLALRGELLADSSAMADLAEEEQLLERFAEKYPHENLASLYTKTTVSELKIAAMAQKDEAAYHAFEEKEIVPFIPAFRKEAEEVSGTVRGNAYHRAMELIDFEDLFGTVFASIPASYESFAAQFDADIIQRNLKAFLEEQVESFRLPEEYFKALSFKKLVHFLCSSMGYRMWMAQRNGKLHREQPFVLGIEASRVKAEYPAEEKMLIQGIIDVYFEEEGQIVLLDYKTDAVASMEALWNRYAVQLDYYAEALSKLTGCPVKEKKLYSFHLEQEG